MAALTLSESTCMQVPDDVTENCCTLHSLLRLATAFYAMAAKLLFPSCLDF